MKHRLLFGMLMVLSAIGNSVVRAQTPAHIWSQRFGDANDQTAIASFDSSGNIIMAGYFEGTIDLGGGPLVSAGGYDIFVAKFDPSGTHQWSKRFGDANYQYATAVIADPSGNVFVTGRFPGTVDFGGGPLTSAGWLDIFVVKFSPDGSHVWSKRFGDADEQLGQAIAVDANGNVAVAGRFKGSVDFGGGPLLAAGGYDCCIAKFSGDGLYQWSKRFGDTTDQSVNAIAFDSLGRLVAAGEFWGSMDLGGGPLVSAGNRDVFVAEFDGAGIFLWDNRYGNASGQSATSLAIDRNDHIVIGGYFYGSIDFGGGTIFSAGASDVFITKLLPSGAHEWSRGFGDQDEQFNIDIALDSNANIAAAGSFYGDISFGGQVLSSKGGVDAFVASLRPDGTHRWSLGFGDETTQQAFAVAVDNDGSVLASGTFWGTCWFGGKSITSAGRSDAFVATFHANPTEPTFSSIVDVGNDQGRRVRAKFERSAYDSGVLATQIVQYEFYRRVDQLPALTEISPTPVAKSQNLQNEQWEFAGAIPAHEQSTYLAIVPTLADSTLAYGQHYSAFFIRAATSDPGIFFDSPIDSGYSIDNLAPGIPANFAYSSGVLSWKESTAEDFNYFTIYGSSAAVFDGAATVVDYTVGTSMDVAARPYPYYFITATDFSGNESKSAFIKTSSGVGGTPTSYVLSLTAYPNPFNPLTTIRYSVPSTGPVTVAIFDPRGVRVTTLVDHEVRNAGSYSVSWSGTNSGRAVASGVYFVKIEQGGVSRSKKLVLLK